MIGRKPPLVSVIMNCYNSAQYLREAIDSVLVQSYQNWEIIFWDNQSTDESATIFKSFSDDRLRYFLAPAFTKLGQARNLAVGQAQGEWLGFLDCDDIWVPDKLAKQVKIITHETSDLGLVYGQMSVIKNGIVNDWSKNLLKFSKKTVFKKLPEGNVFDKLLKINFIPLLTAIVKRTVYVEVGGCSPHFEQAEDYDLFAKIAFKKKIRAVQDVVALYRVHENNISIKNSERGFQEGLEIIRRYLPHPAAVKGLSYYHSSHAYWLLKKGDFKKGVYYFFKYGSLNTIFLMVLQKCTRVIS